MVHVYEVSDGGERVYWAAESEAEALTLHRKHWVEPSGCEEDEDMAVEQMPDDEWFEVTQDDGTGKVVRRCREWAEVAKGYKVPMVASTIW